MDERRQFIEQWLKRQVPFASLCRAFAVSRKTGYKWVERFGAGGVEALADLRRVAHERPHSLPLELVLEILLVKKQFPPWGPRKIRAHLDELHLHARLPAASTIGDVLKRHGLVQTRKRRKHVDPATNPFGRCAQPNDVWCADFKGHFKLANNSRCHPLTISDAHTRYLLRCQALRDQTSVSARPVFESAFREFGLPDAIRTDNGPPFATLGAGALSHLAVWWIKLGVRPERIEPGHPEQNGRHERMHRTLKQETTRTPAASLGRQQRLFDSFRRTYNEVRPHEALGQKPPASAYVVSRRSYPARLLSPEYPTDWEIRRVDQNGALKWRSERFFISESLAHELVGFEPVSDGQWAARYGPIQLGVVDERGERPAFVRPRTKGMKCHPCSRSAV